MKRIYVAGNYSSTNILQVFENMRLGIKKSTELFSRGYSPFCPWLDYHFCLMKSEDSIFTVENFYNYSLAWLEVSDIMYILPNNENSNGTQKEIKRAKELEIPIVYSDEELQDLENGQRMIDFQTSVKDLEM